MTRKAPTSTTSALYNHLINPPFHQSEKNPQSAIALPLPAREVLRPPHIPLPGAVHMSPSPSASDSHSSSPPPPPLLEKPPQFLRRSGPPLFELPLYKQRSWSPDIFRDEAWLRRKGNCKNRRSKSVTDEDLDELKACIELGFGFDSPEPDPRLSDTLPALELFHAVNKQYNDVVTKSTSSLSTVSDSGNSSPTGSPNAIFGPVENPQTMKTRLRQWAQVVACSVRQNS